MALSERIHIKVLAAALAFAATLAILSLAGSLIELGRYGQAGRALQAWVDIKPNLSSYARVSYWRELHGDLAGAAAAMEAAVSAGGDVAENGAYVQALLGNVEFQRGRLA